MNYRLELVDNEDYLHIIVHGVWTNRNGRQIMDEVGAVFAQCAHEGILLDNRDLTVESNAGSDYFDAEYGAKILARTKHRVALMVRRDRVELEKFFVEVLANRGVNVRMFVNLKQAQAWLTRNESAGHSE